LEPEQLRGRVERSFAGHREQRQCKVPGTHGNHPRKSGVDPVDAVGQRPYGTNQALGRYSWRDRNGCHGTELRSGSSLSTVSASTMADVTGSGSLPMDLLEELSPSRGFALLEGVRV